MNRRLFLAFALLLLPQAVFAGNIRKIVKTFTSDGSGNATVAVDEFAGTILRVVTDPGASAPTDNWDVTCTDTYGADLFVGRGVDRDTTTTEQFCPGITLSDGTNSSAMPVTHSGTATLNVSNAGSAKTGTVVIIYAVSDIFPNQ